MGDISPNTDYLSVVSPRDASFDKHKNYAIKTARLYGLEGEDGYTGFMSGKRAVLFANISDKINCCGSWLKFAKFISGAIKLIDARFCHAPNCPMCQWRRSLVMRAKFLTVLPEIRADYPSHRWIFLTLTVKNCKISELKQTINHMRESYNRMRKLADYPIEGYIRSVEVTRSWDWYDAKGEFLGRHGTKWYYQSKEGDKHEWTAKPTDEVHPHYHVLALVPASYFGSVYVKQERWVEMWQKSLRVDYKPVVDIRVIKPKKGKQGEITPENLENDQSGIVQGICETMKYTVKESDLVGQFCIDEVSNSDWLKEFTEQMYRARRVEYSGILKNYTKDLSVEENDNENLIKAGTEDNGTDEVETTTVYSFSTRLERYIYSSDR